MTRLPWGPSGQNSTGIDFANTPPREMFPIKVRVAASNFGIGKPLEGKTPTQVNVGTDDTTDSDGNANSTSPLVTVPSGDNPAIDFGYL